MIQEIVEERMTLVTVAMAEVAEEEVLGETAHVVGTTLEGARIHELDHLHVVGTIRGLGIVGVVATIRVQEAMGEVAMIHGLVTMRALVIAAPEAEASEG